MKMAILGTAMSVQKELNGTDPWGVVVVIIDGGRSEHSGRGILCQFLHDSVCMWFLISLAWSSHISS